jgi:hypothetical protein
MLAILRIACFSLFIGRAWQHFFLSVPYTELFWDEKLMTPLVNWFGMSWDEYSSSKVIEKSILGFQYGIGILFLMSAILLISYHNYAARPISRWILYFMTTILVLISFLGCKEHFYEWGYFFENSIQIACPLLLVLSSKETNFSTNLRWLRPPSGSIDAKPPSGSIEAKNGAPSINGALSIMQSVWITPTTNFINLHNLLVVAVALTFACHGLYAFGYYPLPGNFVEMTISILHCSEGFAQTFLKVMGGVDIVVGFLLVVGRKVNIPTNYQRPTIYYCVVWGFATALARLWANFLPSLPVSSILDWMPEFLIRVPNFLLPIVLLLQPRAEHEPKPLL